MHPTVMDMVVRSITDERLRAAAKHRRMARAAVYSRQPRQRLLRRLTGVIGRRLGASPGATRVPGNAEPCLTTANRSA